MQSGTPLGELPAWLWRKQHHAHSRRATSPVVMCARVRVMPATKAGVRRAAVEGAWAQQIRMDRYIPAAGKEELTWSGMAAGASGGGVANRPPQWNKGQRTLPHNMSEGGAEQLTNPSSWGIQGLEIQQGPEIAVECFSETVCGSGGWDRLLWLARRR